MLTILSNEPGLVVNSYHALALRSDGTVWATALTAIVFYQVYGGLFRGTPRRPELRGAPAPLASHRQRVALLTVVTALVVLGGVVPALFV